MCRDMRQGEGERGSELGVTGFVCRFVCLCMCAFVREMSAEPKQHGSAER